MSVPEPTSGAPAVPPDRRLRSLDALRGFDMFWIVGGNAIFLAWAGANDWKVLDWVAALFVTHGARVARLSARSMSEQLLTRARRIRVQRRIPVSI